MIQSLPENLNGRSLSIVMGMREARPVRRPTGDSEGALDGPVARSLARVGR